MKSHRQAHMKNANLLIKIAVILIYACCCHSGIGIQPQAPLLNCKGSRALFLQSEALGLKRISENRFIGRAQVTEYLTLGFPLEINDAIRDTEAS